MCINVVFQPSVVLCLPKDAFYNIFSPSSPGIAVSCEVTVSTQIYTYTIILVFVLQTMNIITVIGGL